MTDDGAPFMVLEHLRGRTLDEELEAVGGLPPRRVAAIGAQVCRSLMEAHALGIVHRDIKPSNLFLCEFSGARDFVKVLDFGIAKQLGGSAVTQTGASIGTPAYMSPEQGARRPRALAGGERHVCRALRARARRGVDGRVSVVFRGDSGVAVAMAQLSSDAPPLSADVLSSPLGAVIERATNKDIARRFATADELLAALDGTALVPDSTTSPGSGPAESANRVALAPPAEVTSAGPGATATLAAASTNRTLLLVGGGLGVVAAAGLFFGLVRRGDHGRAEPPRPTAVEPVASAAPIHAPGQIPAPVPAKNLGPPPRLAAVTTAQLRERITHLGYTIARESKVDYGSLRGVTFGTTHGELFELLDFQTEAMAISSETGYRTMSGVRYLRSGARMLLVFGGDRHTLEQVVRP